MYAQFHVILYYASSLLSAICGCHRQPSQIDHMQFLVLQIFTSNRIGQSKGATILYALCLRSTAVFFLAYQSSYHATAMLPQQYLLNSSGQRIH